MKDLLWWLNIKQQRDYFVCLLLFKSLNNLLSHYITDKFTMTSEIACRPLDPLQTIYFVLPKVNKAIYTCSLEHSGPVVWNQLPSSIRFKCCLFVKKKHSKLPTYTNNNLNDQPISINLQLLPCGALSVWLDVMARCSNATYVSTFFQSKFFYHLQKCVFISGCWCGKQVHVSYTVVRCKCYIISTK